MSDRRIKVTFHMGTGLCKKEETFYACESISDEELEENLQNWVLENSNSYFTKGEENG